MTSGKAIRAGAYEFVRSPTSVVFIVMFLEAPLCRIPGSL